MALPSLSAGELVRNRQDMSLMAFRGLGFKPVCSGFVCGHLQVSAAEHCDAAAQVLQPPLPVPGGRTGTPLHDWRPSGGERR